MHVQPALYIIGLIFLCNPLINIIDFLPDLIGYLLLLIAIHPMAYVDDKMARLRHLLRILLLISVPKVILGWFSLLGETHFPLLGESTMVLVYTFCFALAEPYFMWRATDAFFDGLYRLGVQEGVPTAVVYRQKKRSGKLIRIGARMQRLTHWFVVLRALTSLLPQFILLTNTTYLEYDIYGVFVDVRDALPVLIIIGLVLMLPLSIVWCVKLLRYLRDIRREGIVRNEVQRQKELLGERYQLLEQQDRFSDSFRVLVLGAVFLFYIDLNGIDILPPFVGCILMMLSLLVIQKILRAPVRLWVWGILSTLVGAGAYAYTVSVHQRYFSAVWQEYSGHWLQNARNMLAENPLSFLRYFGFRLTGADLAAWDAQLNVFLLTAVFWILAAIFLLQIARAVRSYLFCGGQKLLYRYCLETRLDQKRAEQRWMRLYHALRWSIVCMAVCNTLTLHPLFYYFVGIFAIITPIVGILFLCFFVLDMRLPYQASQF